MLYVWKDTDDFYDASFQLYSRSLNLVEHNCHTLITVCYLKYFKYDSNVP